MNNYKFQDKVITIDSHLTHIHTRLIQSALKGEMSDFVRDELLGHCELMKRRIAEIQIDDE